MAVSAARAAAFDILLRVEREDSYASELLNSARYAHLSSADHGLATELTMGVLRWRSLLDDRLRRVSSEALERVDLEVLTALRIGLYQLQLLTRVPGRAAIFESVELVKRARKRSASGFVNAVLRRAIPKTPDVIAGIRLATNTQELANQSAHPESLVERWVERYGFEHTRQICAYDQQVPETAIHIAEDCVEEEFTGRKARAAPGRLLSRARRVQSGDIIRTSAFKAGRAWIQDEASQLVALLVGDGNSIFDCCAAPGGKTSVIASRNPTARVIASDLHPHRARLLRTLANRSNVQVIAADARAVPLHGRFDRVLADVPCSGTGTLAHNPEIKWKVRLQDLTDLQSRQVAILKSVLWQLARGGRLVYSTCSLEREENEAVVESVLGGSADFHMIDCRIELEALRRNRELIWGDVGSLVSGYFLRTIPGVHPCDGFFAAIIERKRS